MKRFINFFLLFFSMLSEEQIKEVLMKQRETILAKKFGIERDILKEIKLKINIPHVVVFTGLRRSGKSTILRQLIKKEYNDEDFYYINFEDERLIDFPANEFNKLYEALVSLFGKKKTFFLDEIQNVTKFETFIRRFYEEGFKFFSFLEFLKLKEFKIEKNTIYKIESKIEIKKYFEEYLINGGMPEYLIYQDQELLSKVYNDTVLKDIAVRHKVENVALLRELYQYLIFN